MTHPQPLVRPNDPAGEPDDLVARYRAIRGFTESLAEPLSPEDAVVQSMPEASPVKWHLAHTTWFFETFVLAAACPGYRVFDDRFAYLFNSYYESMGPRHERPRRGILSRPSLAEVCDYRAHVDDHMQALLESRSGEWTAHQDVIELGLQHEQQHQELVLTDVKHALSLNPLNPAYWADAATPQAGVRSVALAWRHFDEGVRSIGWGGRGFCFDNEQPRHKQHVHAFSLASRPVTNADYLAFMRDGGYTTPTLWLSDGWGAVRTHGWTAPLYWREVDGEWWTFTLGGVRRVAPDESVCHVSYYEADAFARWADARLPTEAEWETAASVAAMDRGHAGFVGNGRLHPSVPSRHDDAGFAQLYGDVWEWTQSAYGPYPGFRPAAGAIGEYNGKFMCNQLVLRGGSCATSASHVRPTYRNFFYPDARWQFSGVRLARGEAA